MIKFEVGKAYTMRFICDSDSMCQLKVVGRTEKTVTLEKVPGYSQTTFRVKVSPVFGDVEFIMPMGSYSMAPILKAERVVESTPIPDNVIDFEEYKQRRAV